MKMKANQKFSSVRLHTFRQMKGGKEIWREKK